MKKKLILISAVFTMIICCLLMSACGNPNEAKINDYIKNNTAFSSMISTMQTQYSEVMDISAYGKGNDLVIEMKSLVELPEESVSTMKDSDEFGVLAESLNPYITALRSEIGVSDANLIYIIKNSNGSEIVNKTIFG